MDRVKNDISCKMCSLIMFRAWQVTMMLEELENSFAELLAERKGGVVAALLAACLRFHTRQREASVLQLYRAPFYGQEVLHPFNHCTND